MATLKFPEWKPDAPDLDNGGLTEALNVLPQDGTYKQFNALSGVSSALNARCQGVLSALDATGTPKWYAGTSTKLYDRAGQTWTDRSGTAYSTASSGYWKFAQFGNRILAVNGETADAMQSVLVTGTNFGNLGGGAPKARHLGVINAFVFAGYTDDSTDGPHRVQWCDIDTPTSWSTPGSAAAAAAQAGAENLNALYGVVTHIGNGEEWGLVFQQRGITRFTYIGGALVFQVQTYERQRGAFYPNAVAQVGNLHYFVAYDGFYATDGVNVLPIGAGKVDRYFLGDMDGDYPERMTVGVDYEKKLIVWSYPGSGSTSGTPNKILAYNFVENRWAHADQTCELVYSGQSAGYTLEDLDSINASLDALGLSLDSPGWAGGVPVLSGFDTSHISGEFTGSAQDATIDTMEASLNEGGLATVVGVQPLVTGSGTVTVKVGTRQGQEDSVSWSSAVTPYSRTNWAGFRETAFYHRVRVLISGGFTQALGVRIRSVPAGFA